MPDNLNGSLNGAIHPEAYYQERRGERQSFRAETDTKAAEMQLRLDDLRDELRKTRELCCDHAGQIGLVYDASTDEVRKPAMPFEPIDPPKREATPRTVMPAFDPKAYGVAPRPPRAPRGWWYQKFWIQAFDWLAWLAILPLGSFLGFSVGMMAGFPVDVRPAWGVAAAVFGVFLLAVMKVAVYEIALIAGRKSVESARRGPLVVGWAIVALFMLAEATLATRAILHYTATQSLSGTSEIPWFVAALAALCFSTPILLTSAYRGHREGTASDDVEARHHDALRAYHDKLERAKREHEAEVKAREAKEEARYESQLREWAIERAKYEDHVNSLDYRTLLKMRSRISVLKTEIAEAETALQAYLATRGHREMGMSRQ